MTTVDIYICSNKEVIFHYVSGTFKTDTAISKFNGQVSEKKLEPWVGPGCNGEDGYELESANAVSFCHVDLIALLDTFCILVRVKTP
jgi:hypothetical protein